MIKRASIRRFATSWQLIILYRNTVAYPYNMYRVATKNAFLFLGSMIGAGFATGAELLVFFRTAGVATVILSAFIIGFMSVIFVEFGKIMNKHPRLMLAIDIAMFVSCIITFCTMQSGIEELFQNNYGIFGIGLVTAIIIAVLSAFSMDFTRKLNTIVIPIVIIMIFAVSFVARPLLEHGSFRPLKAISYASMNLLLGGYLLAKDSGGMHIKHSLFMASIITSITCVMLSIMLNLAKLAPTSAMPLYAIAIENRLGGAACAIIYLAILTTIIGAGKVLAMSINGVFEGKWQGSTFLIALSVVGCGLPFKFLIDTFYPFSGYMGVVICVFVLMFTIVSKTPLQCKCFNHHALLLSSKQKLPQSVPANCEP